MDFALCGSSAALVVGAVCSLWDLGLKPIVVHLKPRL